jgi:hypothetical protein
MTITGTSICNKVRSNTSFLLITSPHSMVAKFIPLLAVPIRLPYLLLCMVAIYMETLQAQGLIARTQLSCIVGDRYIPILEVQSCTAYHHPFGKGFPTMV